MSAGGQDDVFGAGRLRESVLAAWTGSPTRFREDANAEEDLRLGGYRDRLLVELAQNAADAAVAAGAAGTLRLSVVDDGAGGVELRAANTGEPLDAAGVAALASLRASAKGSGNSVGQFGVGFAAVLAVSDAPRVLSRTGGVRFSAERTRQVVADVPELADQVAERGGQVPVLRLVWPVEADEPELPAGFDTEVRLPLRSDVDSVALLNRFAEQAADLLLALPGLSTIEVGERRWWREELLDGVVRLHGPDGKFDWLVHRTSGQLPDAALRELGVEAQRRPEWTVCWAVPLVGKPDEATQPGAGQRTVGRPDPIDQDVLHTPTPTDERLSLPARLLATLPVEPSRQRVMPGPATDAVLAEAARAYPDFIAALAPVDRVELVPRPGFPLSELDDRLRGLLLAELRTAEWLPSADGDEIAPASARVLDAVVVGVGELLTDVLPNLVAAELSEPRHAQALAALDIPRLRLAEVVTAVTGIDRPPSWWARLYAALNPLAEIDSTVRDELSGLPVPLANGRTSIGPRGTLLLDSPADTLEPLSEALTLSDAAFTADAATMFSADVAGLRIVHPEAVHPLLERLGARRAGPLELLEAPALRAAVESSVADAEAGLDTSGLAEMVLGLVEEAGVRPGEQPWLSALALPDDTEEWRRADELVLPSSPLLAVFDPAAVSGETAPLGVLAHDLADRWPADVLATVGVLNSFSVLVDESPTEPNHDLPDEAEWWRAIDGDVEPPARLVAVRDLDLVAEDAWPVALQLLAKDPVTLRALRDPDGYSGWWVARHARLAGQPPQHWRLPDARSLAGLYDPLPADVTLDPGLLTTIGVRDELAVTTRADVADLLDRLGDPERDVPGGVALRGYEQLAHAVRDELLDPTDLDPPERVRVLSGRVVDAGQAVVLDAPWLLGVIPAGRVVVADPTTAPAEALAELLDVPLATETVHAEVTDEGELVHWRDLSAVGLACDLLGVPVPDAMVTVHEELAVQLTAGGDTADTAPASGDADEEFQVSWWVTPDGHTHAEDSPEGLARALAWATGRWPDRHTFAAVLADPVPATLLG
ncbi:sacsin N-terminal ATP-binding-like domain-containing protein [Goodfellowiella coeruleoviolacea]|uniref:Molecular chaperone Hsp90 n=1 Tax=Goodfellowiella coeruleoviolacea TaxID=334858 RepID=A0AAE3KP00_9PSEU|nr:hypothetical protein [Goodfellowiella coeruleoviolacea]